MEENEPTAKAVNNPLPMGDSVVESGVPVPMLPLLMFSIRPRTGCAMTKSRVKMATLALLVS